MHEIWPVEFEPSVAQVDGEAFVRLHFRDRDGNEIAIGYTLAAFVTAADHLRMLAEHLLAGQLPPED